MPSLLLEATQKLLTTITTTLAITTATHAADWNCVTGGGPGHNGLRQIHSDFNRLWGNPRLTIGSGQCLAATCRGLTFGVCNDASYTQTEVSNHRNIAKDTDPGNGGSCAMNVDRVYHAYLKYVFAREDQLYWRPNTMNRRC
ncbi:hypothetical protein BJY04DRAFT_222993 [Aspergillus karnatakaensis]|uniref:uncharacterized protein n=1 Tax=Aspergillus karnatakaensis TaxID=1810916 RepID=UPI003CCD455B